MKDQRYGEFSNFDDFFEDLLNDLNQSEMTDDSQVNEVPVVSEKHDAAENLISDEKKTGNDRAARKKTARDNRGSEDTHAHSNSNDNDAERTARGSSVSRSLLFFVVLTAVTVLAWCLPLRPTVSISEKRNLDSFPAFSVRTLVFGDYFRSIENWFSDTFTFRENWINVGNDIKRLYGIQNVAIYGDIPVADAIPIPSVVPAEVSSEVSEEPVNSDSLTDNPEEVVSPVMMEDQPTEEESWGGLVIDEDALIEDRGAKVLIGDHFFVYPEFNLEYAQKYAKKISSFATSIKDKADFYCVIAPHSVSSMLTREDREKYGFVIEEDAFEYLYGLMNSDVKTVNVLPNLQKHNDEYIVFKSDPHWTALGAYYAYEAWCEVAGVEPVPLSEYKEFAWEDFFGTYYYTGGTPKSIKDNPDIVYAYEPPGDVHLYMDYTNGLKMGTETDLLLDRSTRKVDQYITFLGTDSAKATFINNSIDDDSAVLVLKTSFGNPFVYYLTQHYHYVYVVDVRYYKYSVTRFMEYNKVDDVILIHATDLCYSPEGVQAATFLLK